MNLLIKRKKFLNNWPNLASARSNGGLFVSANIAIKKAKEIGNKGKIFHTAC